jgi:hypothetical protein
VLGRGLSLPALRELWLPRLLLNIKVARACFRDRASRWYLHLRQFKVRELWAESVVRALPAASDRKLFHLRLQSRVVAVCWAP